MPCNAGGCQFDPWSGNQDPTCHGMTKPLNHNYREPAAITKGPMVKQGSHVLQLK